MLSESRQLTKDHIYDSIYMKSQNMENCSNTKDSTDGLGLRLGESTEEWE